VSNEVVSIDTATPQQIVARALASHSVWKGSLMDAISTGTSEFTAAEAATDAECSFGIWLHTEVPFRLRKTWDYATVKKRHAELHTQIGKVLELALTGQHQTASEAMLHGSPFSNAAEQFEAAMTEWFSRVESQAAGNAY
jgi:Chemoreceptor zinc-binding domain